MDSTPPLPFATIITEEFTTYKGRTKEHTGRDTREHHDRNQDNPCPRGEKECRREEASRTHHSDRTLVLHSVVIKPPPPGLLLHSSTSTLSASVVSIDWSKEVVEGCAMCVGPRAYIETARKPRGEEQGGRAWIAFVSCSLSSFLPCGLTFVAALARLHRPANTQRTFSLPPLPPTPPRNLEIYSIRHH